MTFDVNLLADDSHETSCLTFSVGCYSILRINHLGGKTTLVGSYKHSTTDSVIRHEIMHGRIMIINDLSPHYGDFSPFP